MAMIGKSSFLLFFLLSALACTARGQALSPSFYSRTCPSLQFIVSSVMTTAVQRDPRMGASILRLFFHDCFVNGCDGSVLLDDTPWLIGEKNAGGNRNSLRGFEVIDAIKASVEAACNATVSCADILALAARDGVSLLGGPTWLVDLGRRDGRTASRAAADSNLPASSSSLAGLIGLFGIKGLSPRDLTALSGAHTIGRARCVNFRGHIYADRNIDPSFASFRQLSCPAFGRDDNLAPLDTRSQDLFDNGYYRNLVERRGLMHSDQELYNGGSQDSLVQLYSVSTFDFFRDFVAAMGKMGNIGVLTGRRGEIRLNCRRVN
ncbi:peroxidase P7-like [Zingiber officinale]|uniref:peroxidase n=1 Tax=Zingiber officinale TaxID=94328 RepID=A0A8J5H2U2_ZINOF|nr:peroxidase P7-like [Zingiber officinale]KAG6508464.1 hypothetical protein ZIOFF_033838 [Zingiber officinale]